MDGQQDVILVSGGSRGLGLEIIRDLLNRGYQLATFSRSKTDELRELERQVEGRLVCYEGDMQDEQSLKQIVNDVEKNVGPIFGLVNNAGVAIDGVLPIAKVEDLRKVIDINLLGTLVLTRLVSRRMITRSRGSIINISSIIGTRGYSGLAAYSASKAGMDAITRSLAREFGDKQIRVNSVAPGYLKTEMTHGLSDDQMGQVVNRTPLARLGQPQDVTGLIGFLVSKESEFITGNTILVDGGISC